MLEVNNLFHATRIIEGYGVIETTGQECANLGFGKVLVITDPFLASSEHYKKLKKSLDDAKIENFLLTNVKPNPRAEDCDEMAEFAKKNHVDALIALGGGSAMDQAKAVGAVVTNGKSTVEWGDTELDTNILPLICIPSTSGTGAEVTWCAVITDTERQYKMTVGDPVHMIPVLAICDPEITIGLPKSLTAACGVDALTHCIEAYTVQLHQPITDALALKGISMIAENLEKAYENGEDREARRNMMIASTIGGMAFISSNVGAVHAFAETVGAWFDTPHGVANSLFLPYIMEFNIPACPERFADIADAMGIEREESMSDEQYALKAVEYVKALNRKLNIPTIKEIKGITEAVVVRVTDKKADEAITLEDIEPYKEEICEGKIVLFNTNWYKTRGTDEFFHHPYVNGDVAKYLVDNGVRFIGIDTINTDQTGGTEFPVHDLFSEKRLMIGENWAFFDQIDFERPYVIALPMKLIGCDGSPVRAIAVQWEEE